MAGVFHIKQGLLKIPVYVLRGLAVISNCKGTRVENDIRCTKHTQHTRASHMPFSHTTFFVVRWTKRTSCISHHDNKLNQEQLHGRPVRVEANLSKIFAACVNFVITNG